jgi:hypothetical protein
LRAIAIANPQGSVLAPQLPTVAAKGIEPIGKDAAAFDDAVRRDTRLWGRVVKEAQIRLD